MATPDGSSLQFGRMAPTVPVSDIERVERLISRVSRRSSSRVTRLLTSDLEMPRCFAACEKLIVFATKQKTMKSLE